MEVHYNLAAALVANICGVLILVSFLFNSNFIRNIKIHAYNRWMVYMIIVCITGCLTEIVFELINGQVFPFARQLNLLVKTLNHAESMFAGLLFVGCMRSLMYEGEEHWPKTLRRVSAAICTFGAAVLIINLFTGIAFRVSPENVYSRGPLGQLGLFMSIATLIYTVIFLSIENKKSKTYLRFPVALYTIPFIVGGGLQMVNPSFRLSCVAFAFGIVTIHLNQLRTLLYTDIMTGVFNRTYLDYYFSEISKKTERAFYSGLLVDVNSFKEINDNYGHAVGDDAIKNSARILKETCGSDYLIMRYGGDEFILIREHERMEAVVDMKNNIKAAAEAFNIESDCPYELSFSIGVTVFDSSEGEFNTFLEQMDKSMYQDKKMYYASTGKDRRK